jgi:hypothetical protein
MQGWTGSARAEVIAVQQHVFVGIDVSKMQLEVAFSTGEGFAIGNDQRGIAELIRRLHKAAPTLVVFEASDYERAAWIALWEAGFAVARVNPRDSYHFAQARRRLAKTDRIDARGLCEFAARVQPTPNVPPEPANEELRALVIVVASSWRFWSPSVTAASRCPNRSVRALSVLSAHSSVNLERLTELSNARYANRPNSVRPPRCCAQFQA